MVDGEERGLPMKKVLLVAVVGLAGVMALGQGPGLVTPPVGAAGLSANGGRERLTLTNGMIRIVAVSNTAVVRVTAVFGAGYNGPAVGVAWSAFDQSNDGSGQYGLYTNAQAFPEKYSVRDILNDRVWNSEAIETSPFPVRLTASDPYSIGEFTLDFVPGTNVYYVGNPASLISGGYVLACDSMDWRDSAAWISEGATNGAAVAASLGLYAGYPWQACYSQATNGQQGRVFVASIAAPPIAGAKLNSIRFLFRGLNLIDTTEVQVFQAGQTVAFMTNTLELTYSESIHELIVPVGVDAGSGFTLMAVPKVTAETLAGSWTALPRAEAVWGK